MKTERATGTCAIAMRSGAIEQLAGRFVTRAVGRIKGGSVKARLLA